MGDCEGGEEDEDGGEFDSIVGTWIGIGGEGVWYFSPQHRTQK